MKLSDDDLILFGDDKMNVYDDSSDEIHKGDAQCTLFNTQSKQAHV